MRRETASDACTPTRSLPHGLLGLPDYLYDLDKYFVSDVRPTVPGPAGSSGLFDGGVARLGSQPEESKRARLEHDPRIEWSFL